MSPEDRFLSDGTLAALREYFRLDSFLSKFPQSRDRYFALVSGLQTVYRNAECPISDHELRELVARAVKNNRSYRDYLANDRSAETDYLLDPEKWQALLVALAGTILCQYEGDSR